MSTTEPEQNFLDPLDPTEPKVFEAPGPTAEDESADLTGFDPFWEEGGDLPGALEALFTAAGEVLDIPKLRELTGFPEGALRQAIEKLQERLQPPRGLRLIEVGGGWRMATSPLYTELVSRMVTTVRSGRLTPAQLEALSIIAYRQPVTSPEINQIRGVSSSATQIKSLLERDLIVTAGRKPVVGRPMMYSTTQPCVTCAKMIINSGIVRVVCEKKYHAAKITREFFKKAGVDLTVLNDEVEEYPNQ